MYKQIKTDAPRDIYALRQKLKYESRRLIDEFDSNNRLPSWWRFSARESYFKRRKEANAALWDSEAFKLLGAIQDECAHPWNWAEDILNGFPFYRRDCSLCGAYEVKTANGPVFRRGTAL